MAIIGKPHTGDKNTDFQLEVFSTNNVGVNVLVDLSGVSVMKMIFTSPLGVEKGPFTASILNLPGTDGIIRYINSDVTLLDSGGLWHYRAKITFSGGGIFESNDDSFEVLSVIT